MKTKKILLSIALMAITQTLTAQAQITFQRVLPPLPAPQITPVFDGVSQSSIAFSDIDGDSDTDVLISGEKSGIYIAKLYTNDGTGNYMPLTGTPFDGVHQSSIAFSDIDGDSDSDVLITGLNSSNQRIAKLYTNDGTGSYTLVTGTPFDGVQQGSIAFSDIDGDNDSDVLITGLNSSNQRIAKLYTNDGSGNYTLVTGTPFDGVHQSSIAFSDIDGDSDSDVLITGFNSSGQRIAKLYTNDGSGNYTQVTGIPFDGITLSSIAFSDIDGDSDSDVLITGYNSSGQPIAKLYTNDGSGNYTLVTGTPFDGVSRGSIAFSDIDGDSDSDVLITGLNSSTIAKLYTNDGSGNYTLVTGTSFDGVQQGSIAFSDIDGDSDADVLITGFNSTYQRIAKLYTNDGSGNYTLVTGSLFDEVQYGSVAFSDIDGDSDADVLITGRKYYFQQIAKLYTNDGSGNYTLVAGTPFDGVEDGSIAFSDIEGDSDADVLITGLNSSGQRIAKLYTNDGSGNYTLVTGTPFDGVYQSSIAFSDIDGDSDEDVLITGRNSSNQVIAKLYTNDGSGNYTLVTGTPLDGVQYGSIAFSDIEGDSDEDVLITGLNSSGQNIAKLYTNDGSGNYSLVTGTPFDGVQYGSIAFSDIDGDSDSDVLITGRISSYQRIAKLYTNDGSGNYSLVTGTPFDGVYLGSIAFSDIDGDSDSDVLITGLNSSNQRIAKLYTNDGSGNYSLVTGTPFDGVQYSSIAFSDIDGDSDADVLITGFNSSGQEIASLFRNTSCSPSASADNVVSCDNYTWATTGQSYTASGTYRDTLTNAAGCDSVVTLNLTINSSSTGSQTEVACENYIWLANSTTYTSTGTYTATLTNAAGCDSIVTLDLTINNPNTGTDTQTACDSYTWIDGNTYTSSNNTATHTLTNVAGCDSVVTLDLTINSNTGTDTQTACDSYTWIDGNTYTTSNNTATHTLTNAAGCDSIVTLDLTINNVSDITTSVSGITIEANNNNASYVWLDCDNNYAILTGETNQSYTAITNGNYAVELTEIGCVDTSACVAITTVGIIENDFIDNLTVYPNPTQGSFSVDMGKSFTMLSVNITDLTGKTIQSQTFKNTQLLNLKIEEPAGVYFLTILSEESRAVIRLVKK